VNRHIVARDFNLFFLSNNSLRPLMYILKYFRTTGHSYYPWPCNYFSQRRVLLAQSSGLGPILFRVCYDGHVCFFWSVMFMVAWWLQYPWRPTQWCLRLPWFHWRFWWLGIRILPITVEYVTVCTHTPTRYPYTCKVQFTYEVHGRDIAVPTTYQYTYEVQLHLQGNTSTPRRYI
jgi:hypothetical protein